MKDPKKPRSQFQFEELAGLKSGAELRAWERAMDAQYVSGPGEYVAPAGQLVVVDHSAAATVAPHDKRPFDDLPAIWRAVRGTEFRRAETWSSLGSGEPHQVYAELVPQPGNPYDSTAVAIYLNGHQIGYAPASYAEHAHWMVRQLNVLGHRVLVAGTFFRSESTSASAQMFVALPTFHVLRRHMPSIDTMTKRFGVLWQQLSEEVRAAVVAGASTSAMTRCPQS
ncbi:HIRAN domain-containing protein [Agrococcus sp. Marseille-Q4369]|uniref:HIRAN domain-containing protein n=1 Tax=Agrococcus sp. Marseille-Q4369 TaxID=2810513 RepID=UPI001B8D89DD|nr:HIRAN domain-containing protein [Agrococcus sp. Marseille-Q4369]QUW19362.1 HIRAN domain-containing protein [Agrococcus sp. Marseille-Q4369]